MYTPLTHEQHLELADEIRALKKIRSVLLDKTMRHYGKSSKIGTLVIRFGRLVDDIPCELDNLYHAVTSDAQFKEQGHAYYGGKPAADARAGISPDKRTS